MSPPSKRRAVAAMTSFGIVVLAGAAVAIYLCTPQRDAPALAPARAIAIGFAGAAATFVLSLAFTLGATLTGLADATEQLRSKGKVSTPAWMKATVSVRAAMVYLLYGFLGFALGGLLTSSLQLLHRGS